MFYVINRQSNRIACEAETMELAVHWITCSIPNMDAARKTYRIANRRGDAKYARACEYICSRLDANNAAHVHIDTREKAKIGFGKYEGYLIENVPTRGLYARQDMIMKGLTRARDPKVIAALDREYDAINAELESRPDHHRSDTAADDRRIDDAEDEVFVPSMEGDKLRKLETSSRFL